MFSAIKKFFKKSSDDIFLDDQIDNGIPDGREWMGVDLDGTLARYDRSLSYGRIGPPVPEMMALVKKMISHGVRVKIFTARVQDPDQIPVIRNWLRENGLPELEITNVKDFAMIRLYDDRCIQVERNTGRLIVDK